MHLRIELMSFNKYAPLHNTFKIKIQNIFIIPAPPPPAPNTQILA